MSSDLTAEEVDTAEENKRIDERARSIAWAFAGVHKNDDHKAASAKPADPPLHKYAEEDRQRLRVSYLGWMFGGVHIDKAHKQWDELSSAEKQELRAKLSNQQGSDEQIGRLLHGIKVKRFHVITDEGVRAVPVIEDSASANNWISNAQMRRLGLYARRGNKITSKTITGEEFSSDEYVDVPWEGKASRKGMAQFLVAPPKSPIELLVGESFIEKHPEALMDQEAMPQLVTVQSSVQVDEKQRIDAKRKRVEEEANMLERRRRPNPPPAPPTQTGTQLTRGPGQSSSIEKTSP